VAVPSEPRLAELRERLAAERADGASFGAAWQRARAEALAGLSSFDKTTWASVLLQTRAAWRSAYYGGRSSRVEGAVTELETYAADGELDALRYELPAA
jgi:hypothetical protein